MDGFQGIDIIYQKDGLVTRIVPVRYEERQNFTRRFAQRLRNEGNNENEALGAVMACNMACYRPMLTEEELKEIIKPIFSTPLTFTGIHRNKKILDLVRDFRKRGISEEQILKQLQLVNSRCCNPPLSDDDLTWIMANNAYMIENRSFFQVDKEVRQDGKTFIRIGQSIDLGGRG
jgi:hypothetical protein